MKERYDYISHLNMQGGMTQKPEITLPVIALAFDFAPILFILLTSLSGAFFSLALIGIFSPVIGVLVGIIALCQGRRRIGTAGIIISAIAIALPIVFVLTMILLLRTGAVAIGM